MVSSYDPSKARCFRNYVAIYLIIALAFSSCLGPIVSVTAARHFRDYLSSKALNRNARSSQLRSAASSAALQQENSCQTAGTRLDNQVMRILIPPLLFFLLSISKCDASVLNPQSIAIRGPCCPSLPLAEAASAPLTRWSAL